MGHWMNKIFSEEEIQIVIKYFIKIFNFLNHQGNVYQTNPFTLVRMSTIWEEITENGGDEREILYKFTHLVGVQLHTDNVEISPEDKKIEKKPSTVYPDYTIHGYTQKAL